MSRVVVVQGDAFLDFYEEECVVWEEIRLDAEARRDDLEEKGGIERGECLLEAFQLEQVAGRHQVAYGFLEQAELVRGTLAGESEAPQDIRQVEQRQPDVAESLGNEQIVIAVIQHFAGLSGEALLQVEYLPVRDVRIDILDGEYGRPFPRLRSARHDDGRIKQILFRINVAVASHDRVEYPHGGIDGRGVHPPHCGDRVGQGRIMDEVQLLLREPQAPLQTVENRNLLAVDPVVRLDQFNGDLDDGPLLDRGAAGQAGETRIHVDALHKHKNRTKIAKFIQPFRHFLRYRYESVQ